MAVGRAGPGGGTALAAGAGLILGVAVILDRPAGRGGIDRLAGGGVERARIGQGVAVRVDEPRAVAVLLLARDEDDAGVMAVPEAARVDRLIAAGVIHRRVAAGAEYELEGQVRRPLAAVAKRPVGQRDRRAGRVKRAHPALD